MNPLSRPVVFYPAGLRRSPRLRPLSFSPALRTREPGASHGNPARPSASRVAGLFVRRRQRGGVTTNPSDVPHHKPSSVRGSKCGVTKRTLRSSAPISPPSPSRT